MAIGIIHPHKKSWDRKATSIDAICGAMIFEVRMAIPKPVLVSVTAPANQTAPKKIHPHIRSFIAPAPALELDAQFVIAGLLALTGYGIAYFDNSELLTVWRYPNNKRMQEFQRQ